jgi:hypothetical protein
MTFFLPRRPPPPPLPPPATPAQREEWAALGAEWADLATNLDARAAAWEELARRWRREGAGSRGAAERAEWAAQRARDLAAWIGRAAGDLLALG